MNLGQSLRTGETGETCFWDQGPAQKSWPIIGDRRDGRNMLLGARSGSEILANHWGQERREKHAFGCKVRLRNPGQSLKSWPIIGDRRDGRDMFLGARSGSEILPIIGDRRDGRDMFLGARSGS
jgi:hypothetical protein